MKELQDIVGAVEEAKRSGKTAILATVVQVEGSAYRRPGARMLITEDGWRAGSVSGGCLEGDLLEKARRLADSGEPALVSYNTTDEGDIVLGVGVGCRGIVRILVERLTPGRKTDPVTFLETCLLRRRTGVLATVFRLDGSVGAKVGARLLLDLDGDMLSDLQDAELTALVEAEARRVLVGERSVSRMYALRSGAADVFFELIRPPIPLVIFGAGHDAIPMVRLAKELGWHVTVVDGRPAYATAQRFPSADGLVVSHPETMRERVPLDEETAALVMTHNYLHDQKLLETLLPSPVQYIGVLGPKSRTDQLLSDLKDEGMTWTEEQLARLYAPVGLDIGAEDPEGIALAILAEIQAVRSNRSGGSLRERTGPIHLERGSEPPATGQTSWTRAKATCGLSVS